MGCTTCGQAADTNDGWNACNTDGGFGGFCGSAECDNCVIKRVTSISEIQNCTADECKVFLTPDNELYLWDYTSAKVLQIPDSTQIDAMKADIETLKQQVKDLQNK